MNASRRTWFGILTLGLAIGLLSSGIRAEDKKPASSATGTWKSSFTTKDGNTFETIYKLKQDGEKLSGIVTGRDGNDVKIEEGKVKDGKVSFQVTRELKDRKVTIKYKGDLNGDAIKGKVEFGQGDQARSFDWEAKRQKEAADKKKD
jgi:ribosomal protein L21